MRRRTVLRLMLTSCILPVIGACGVGVRAEIGEPFYACEGCEAVAERAPDSLDWRAQIAPDDEPGERLVLRGVVFRSDGRTPAPDVVIYTHHTNAEGRYANGEAGSQWSRRHGRLRGWIRTGVDGRYEFRTIKPGPYPDRSEPAHIHLFVGEPGRRPYWIDDVVFDGAAGVDARYRAFMANRGGSGVVSLTRDASGVLLARRDIILAPDPGRNVG
jgi:protocatechuate 3,4-dioxygenase, beta subunit